MTKKSGLGRGLDALIPSGEFTPETPTEEHTSGYENQILYDFMVQSHFPLIPFLAIIGK